MVAEKKGKGRGSVGGDDISSKNRGFRSLEARIMLRLFGGQRGFSRPAEDELMWICLNTPLEFSKEALDRLDLAALSATDLCYLYGRWPARVSEELGLRMDHLNDKELTEVVSLRSGSEEKTISRRAARILSEKMVTEDPRYRAILAHLKRCPEHLETIASIVGGVGE